MLTAGGAQHGSKFVGKWVNTTDPCDKIEITRNGQQFLIGKAPATYKDDGTLQARSPLDTITVTYIKESDTLDIAIAFGMQEYKRDHSSEGPISSSEFVGKWVSELGTTVDITRNGEQFLMFYTLPGVGFAKPETAQFTLIYKDGALLRMLGPRVNMRLTYASCSDTLHLDSGLFGSGSGFKRVK